MLETDRGEMLKYGVLVPHSKLRREFNQWIKWIERHPENSVIVTRAGVSVAVLVSNSDAEEL